MLPALPPERHDKQLGLARTIYIWCTVYIRFFWRENHQMYGHIRCIYTVLANPTNNQMLVQVSCCFCAAAAAAAAAIYSSQNRKEGGRVGHAACSAI